MSRTVITFTPAVDPWPVIDAWATSTNYKVVGHHAWGRIYERGDGFFVSKSFAQFDVTQAGLTVSAWAPFWISGTELDVHSSDPLNFFPRRKARALVNRLLASFGVPPI